MRSPALIGLLAESARLRVVSALVLGADTVSEVTRVTGLAPPVVLKAIRRLESGGLTTWDGPRIVFHEDVFTRAARADAPPREEPAAGDADDPAAAVLRAFVRNGRLVQIPAAERKRGIVLEHLARQFEPGVRYSEREVNALLGRWHPDHAALRRYLVDAGLMARADGRYWRSGGPADVDPAPADTSGRTTATATATDTATTTTTAMTTTTATGTA